MSVRKRAKLDVRVNLPRHPGLDPGPASSLIRRREKEGGPRVKPGMTMQETSVSHA